jgi:hypothetical protein
LAKAEYALPLLLLEDIEVESLVSVDVRDEEARA